MKDKLLARLSLCNKIWHSWDRALKLVETDNPYTVGPMISRQFEWTIVPKSHITYSVPIWSPFLRMFHTYCWRVEYPLAIYSDRSIFMTDVVAAANELASLTNINRPIYAPDEDVANAEGTVGAEDAEICRKLYRYYKNDAKVFYDMNQGQNSWKKFEAPYLRDEEIAKIITKNIEENPALLDELANW